MEIGALLQGAVPRSPLLARAQPPQPAGTTGRCCLNPNAPHSKAECQVQKSEAAPGGFSKQPSATPQKRSGALPTQQQQINRSSVKCGNCGGWGHFRKECPYKPRRHNPVNQLEDDSDADPDAPDTQHPDYKDNRGKTGGWVKEEGEDKDADD